MTNALTTLRLSEEVGLRNALDALLKSGHATPAAKALHAHFFNDDHNRLRFHFEQAHGQLPDLPYNFAEGLFRLYDDAGERIPSDKALQSLEGIQDQTQHVASRTRFWLAVAAIEQFFDTHPDHTHLSLNISALAAQSSYFTRRFIKAIDALHAVHPDKNLIVEMLEHHPWQSNRAITQTLKELVAKGCSLAVDDYGADSGSHGPPTLQLVQKLSKNPPLVKIDGQLVERAIETEETFSRTRWMRTLVSRLQEVRKHSPDALLVFEWVKNEGQIQTISEAMGNSGLHDQAVHYVQGERFMVAPPAPAAA